MAVSKKATHIVTHAKLNLAVDGKLQRMAKGAQINLSAKVAESLMKKGFIEKIGDKETLEISEKVEENSAETM